jgi:hypothetical protein
MAGPTKVASLVRQPLDQRIQALSNADLEVIRGQRQPRNAFDNGFDNGFNNIFDNGFDNGFNSDSLLKEAHRARTESDGR